MDTLRRRHSSAQKKAVSVIIPALNEEATIRQVILAARAHPMVSEVIVVDDGSTDATARLAEKAGARVLSILENRGKGEAMAAGADVAKNDLLIFLDADLIGLQTSMITVLIDSLRSGEYDMFTLIRERTMDPLPFIPDSLIIGGERAVTRSLWNLIPAEERQGFDVELALNFYAKKLGLKTGAQYMPGLDQVIKEKKYGFFRGFSERIKMVLSCLRAYFKLHVLGFMTETLENMERR